MKYKYALVEGIRRQAEPGLTGKCQGCGSAMTAKCGERRVWHWAHLGDRQCDRWWEPETPWHRSWKEKFPDEWQEVIHWAEDGEKHIADVKTEHGQVIEIQHSYLKPTERRSREEFYPRLFWVVDGLRRMRDKSSFEKALRLARVIRRKPLTFLVPPNHCALLREWADSRVGVFFDFGSPVEDIIRFGVPVLWRLDPKSPKGWALLAPIPQVSFLDAFLKETPLKGIDFTSAIERACRIPVQTGYRRRQRRPHWSTSSQRYMARKQRAPARRRM